MTQVNLAKLIAENFQKDATLLAIKMHFHIIIRERCDAHHLPLSNHVVTSDDTKHQASISLKRAENWQRLCLPTDRKPCSRNAHVWSFWFILYIIIHIASQMTWHICAYGRSSHRQWGVGRDTSVHIQTRTRGWYLRKRAESRKWGPFVACWNVAVYMFFENAFKICFICVVSFRVAISNQR